MCGAKNRLTAIAKDPEGETPVDKIKSILSRFCYVNVKAPRFFGGMMGYFAYDCVYSLFLKVREGHKGTTASLNARDTKDKDADFMLTKDCIVFDHAEQKLYIFSSPFLTYESDLTEEYNRSREKIRELGDRIVSLASGKRAGFTKNQKGAKKPEYNSSVSQEAFERSVGKIQEHIVAGDIFQAVLSRRIECAIRDDPFAIYAALREINPSPYMYYLDFGDEQVIGASPEMLVRVERRRVTTVPIAGTRPRGRDTREDGQLARELLEDPKELAEHTMLVDLARNDIGRVCPVRFCRGRRVHGSREILPCPAYRIYGHGHTQGQS